MKKIRNIQNNSNHFPMESTMDKGLQSEYNQIWR